MKVTLLSMALLVVASFSAPAQNTVGKDLKNAGSDTKKAAKKSTSETKKGVKKGTHKAASETEKGAHKVKQKTTDTASH
jgi:predicted small secreted protein